jgi:hypothetical protein
MNPYNNLILLNDEDKTEDIEKIEHSKVSWFSKPKELNANNYMFHIKARNCLNTYL